MANANLFWIFNFFFSKKQKNSTKLNYLKKKKKKRCRILLTVYLQTTLFNYFISLFWTPNSRLKFPLCGFFFLFLFFFSFIKKLNSAYQIFYFFYFSIFFFLLIELLLFADTITGNRFDRFDVNKCFSSTTNNSILFTVATAASVDVVVFVVCSYSCR